MRVYEVYAVEGRDLSKKELIGVIPERRKNGSWLDAMKLSLLLFGSLIPMAKEVMIKEKRI
jgi:hypothetical protein